MITILKVIYESIRQALQSLIANKLRSFLSLVGITIGIFSIISVKSAVDSLEDNVKDGFSELGSNAVYVEKFPWNENFETSYWKYIKRPEPSLDDFEAIKKKSKFADETTFNVFTGGKTISHKSSSVSDAFIMGSAYEYQSIQKLDIGKGRYFTNLEYNAASNKTILGYEVAEQLFQNEEQIGKLVKVFGQKFQVIGVLEKEGESPFNMLNFDEVLWLPLTTIRRFVNIRDERRVGRFLMVQAKSDILLDDLKSELTGIIRAQRRLRPKQEDNFSLMEMSLLNQVLEGFFSTLNIAGFIIGGFALIVGMISVANIMFVSVKERTNIIGIKKAIGAKNTIILLEFLIEAIVLCIIGGVMGLLVSYGLIIGISKAIDFQMSLSMWNAMFGIIISVIVGIISGIIPAYLASRLDPVVAIRQ